MAPVRLRCFRRKKLNDAMIGALHEGGFQDTALATKHIQPGHSRRHCRGYLASRLLEAS